MFAVPDGVCLLTLSDDEHGHIERRGARVILPNVGAEAKGVGGQCVSTDRGDDTELVEIPVSGDDDDGHIARSTCRIRAQRVLVYGEQHLRLNSIPFGGRFNEERVLSDERSRWI